MTIRRYTDVKPNLPTRSRVEGKVEVQCLACNQWRPDFCIVEIDGEWQCDAEVSRRARADGGNA